MGDAFAQEPGEARVDAVDHPDAGVVDVLREFVRGRFVEHVRLALQAAQPRLAVAGALVLVGTVTLEFLVAERLDVAVGRGVRPRFVPAVAAAQAHVGRG